MNTNTEELLYDSPEDITSVDLTIRAVSGNVNPAIYANGRNQLPVEIIAKAMKLDPTTHTNIVLKFSQETWIHILNLRHAESDEKLTWLGSAGWCYTNTKNEYSREIITENNLTEPRYMEPGDELMTFYVHSDDISMKRIAVSIDTDGGKHFTTADRAAGAERCSVSVKAIAPISYSNAQNLKIIEDDWETKVSPLTYKDQEKGIAWANEHKGGFIRRRKLTVITANGYSIVHKIVPKGLSENYKQAVFYHNVYMPHAFSLAEQSDGCYLNSWFIMSGNHNLGYARGLNDFFHDMTISPLWPDLYFSSHSSGEYTAGTWAFWPYTGKNDSCWEQFTDEQDNISIVCFQLHIPDGSSRYWGEHCRPDYTSNPAVPITIVDIYGNKGTFNITFNSSVTGEVAVSPE